MSVLAKHAQGKGASDKIFGISAIANARAAVVGKENITNATIGAFLDADGKLITLKTVEDTVKEIPFAEAAEYAPIEGTPGFIQAAIDATFREYKPNAYMDGIATPGGTGSIHHAMFNYLEDGDTVLTIIGIGQHIKVSAGKQNRKFDTFVMFDEAGNFNVQGCIDKLREYAAKQTNVFLILNTPANNPTGYNMKKEEMAAIIAELTAIANNGKNNVVLLLDIAYLDFAEPKCREMFLLLNDLPQNFLTLIAFSMSKSYTMYGYRLGCLICVSSNQQEVEDFVTVNKFSGRATWSNCSRLGMQVMERINNDPERKAAFHAEQEELRLSLLKRAELFVKEADEIGLKVCPFDAGFFITVPTVKAEEVAAELRKKDLFVVPLGDGANAGLRIALCAIPEEKITGSPKMIKEALDTVGE